MFARIYNLKKPRARIDELLERFGITKLRDKAIARLSSGENTRVGLCKAFMNDPELLLLDEPTAYLDPEVSWQVKNALLDAQREKGTTILYTSHNMAEVERMCKRIVFLHHGKVIAVGSPIEITQALLEEEREEPALEEVFARGQRQGSMKLHRINAVIVRHIYESRRNFDRVVDMIWWPVLDIVMWGFFTVYLSHSNRLQPNVVSCFLGGIILWGTFYSFQRDMAVGFIDELWCQTLSICSTPLTLAEYMDGLF